MLGDEGLQVVFLREGFPFKRFKPSLLISRLILKPKHYDSCVLGGWIGADVREVHVERDDGPAFANAD